MATSKNDYTGSSNSDANEMQQQVKAEEYPHGIRLYLLVGASLSGIFLISLDQVRNSMVRRMIRSSPPW